MLKEQFTLLHGLTALKVCAKHSTAKLNCCFHKSFLFIGHSSEDFAVHL